MTEPSSSFPERPSLPPSCPTSVRRDPQSLLSPSWWRHGHIPLLVLIASGFAADFMFGTLEGLGIGTALGLLLYTAAFLALRTDLSRKEQVFLVFMAVLNAAAAGANLTSFTLFNLLIGLGLPVVITFLPRKEGNSFDPAKRYVTWWGYKFFRMTQAKEAAANVLGKIPLAGSGAIGVILFLVLPVHLCGREPCGRRCQNSHEQMVLELLLLAGSGYGNGSGHPPVVPGSPGIRHCSHAALPLFLPGTTPRASGSPWLPHLPAVSLLFINLAFLVNNGTDVAFLWRGSVPDGISQTAYLHDGADSIMLAAFLSALVLLVLFRPEGSVRASKTGIVLGFILAAQTGLLAAQRGHEAVFPDKRFRLLSQPRHGRHLFADGSLLPVPSLPLHGRPWKLAALWKTLRRHSPCFPGPDRAPQSVPTERRPEPDDDGQTVGLVFQRWRPAAL